jgi:hypothetical protein
MENPFLWGLLVFPIVLFNIIANGKLTSDPLFSHDKKLLLMVVLWCLPVVGYFVVRAALGTGWSIKPDDGNEKSSRNDWPDPG